jgi:hypothetical protein
MSPRVALVRLEPLDLIEQLPRQRENGAGQKEKRYRVVQEDLERTLIRVEGQAAPDDSDGPAH